MILNNIKFNYHVLDEYYDTGNLNSYSKTCESFKSNYNVIAKPNENLCFFKNKVIKFINDKGVNRKRLVRGNDLYPLTPKIVNYRDNYICMELVRGKLLAECKTYGLISQLLEWARTNLWSITDTKEEYATSCLNFYKTKTYERLSKIPFLHSEITSVNGIKVGTVYDLLERIDFSRLQTTTFTKFHGDFILDNIIKTEDSFILLDWRHEFDNNLYFGDQYYDLAKLRHNIIFNHANIGNEMYSVEKNETNVDVDIKCNYILIKQLEEYNKFLDKYGYDADKIKILTAIIWLNMAPLYEGKLREFLFYFGKLNLYLALQDVRP
jgi:thiamine kinase-like enzyme